MFVCDRCKKEFKGQHRRKYCDECNEYFNTPSKPCACGCGELVRPRSTWIVGHHTRTKEMINKRNETRENKKRIEYCTPITLEQVQKMYDR